VERRNRPELRAIVISRIAEASSAFRTCSPFLTILCVAVDEEELKVVIDSKDQELKDLQHELEDVVTDSGARRYEDLSETDGRLGKRVKAFAHFETLKNRMIFPGCAGLDWWLR